MYRISAPDGEVLTYETREQLVADLISLIEVRVDFDLNYLNRTFSITDYDNEAWLVEKLERQS